MKYKSKRAHTCYCRGIKIPRNSNCKSIKTYKSSSNKQDRCDRHRILIDISIVILNLQIGIVHIWMFYWFIFSLNVNSFIWSFNKTILRGIQRISQKGSTRFISLIKYKLYLNQFIELANCCIIQRSSEVIIMLGFADL